MPNSGPARAVLSDFTKIGLLPPERASRLEARFPLTAPPLPGALQAKLVVGQVNDPLEHEADRVADQVMRIPAPEVSISATPPQLSHKGAACKEDAQTLQTKSAEPPGSTVNEAPGIVHEVLRSPGQALDAPTRAFFEPRFGHDFSKVRVHTDEQAAQAARSMSAEAYTVGNQVVFAADRYAPSLTGGRRLLAHELAHVVQQSGRALAPATVQRDTTERDSGSPDTATGGMSSATLGSGQFKTPDSAGPFVLLNQSSNVQVAGHIDFLPEHTSLAVFLALEQGGNQYNGLLWFSDEAKSGDYRFTFSSLVPSGTWFLRFEARSSLTQISIPNVTGNFILSA